MNFALPILTGATSTESSQSLADLIASLNVTRRELARGINLTPGKVFVLLNGQPPRERHVPERIAGYLDVLPSVIKTALVETTRQAALVAPDLLLQPECLSELRALANLTQGQLARKSRIAVTTVANIESGHCWATAATIHALTRGLGLDPKNPCHLERVRRAVHFGNKAT